jgi:hypothetical protein
MTYQDKPVEQNDFDDYIPVETTNTTPASEIFQNDADGLNTLTSRQGFDMGGFDDTHSGVIKCNA